MFLTNILLGFDRYFYFPHIYLGLQFALERNLLLQTCPCLRMALRYQHYLFHINV